MSTPMRRNRSPCCARAASGHAAAAPPRSDMKVRRLIRSPPHNLRSSASAVRRKNDAKQHPLVDPFLLGSADMSTAIRRDYIIDLVSGNRHPGTVHLNFVVVADHTTLGRPTIHQIAARASVISFECRVESLMPFIVAYSVVSFLRC